VVFCVHYELQILISSSDNAVDEQKYTVLLRYPPNLWVGMTHTWGYLNLQKPMDHLKTCRSNLRVRIRMGLKPVGHDWLQEI